MQHEVGRSNGGLGGVVAGRFLGVTYVVYGTAENVLVLNADCELLQVLRHPNHARLRGTTVRYVDFCSTTGRLAAAYGNQVLVFAPTQVKEARAQWDFEFSLEHQSAVRAVSWHSASDLLLTGGDGLTVWRAQRFAGSSTLTGWSKVWQTSCASPVVLARFSPDGRFFATMTENDRLLKVWYKPEAELLSSSSPTIYQFIYLHHPRAVLNFTWRRPSTRSGRTALFTRNILLTTCADSVCRIWSETSVEESIRFFMCAMIDPKHMTVSVESDSQVDGPFGWFDSDELYTALEAAVQSERLKSDTSAGQDGSAPGRLSRQMSSHVPFSLRSNMFSSSNEIISQRRFPPGIEFFRKLRSRLPGILSDSPDLIFQVQHDGSLVIWGIQHLTEEPRKIPKVVLVLRTPSALPRYIGAALCPDLFVFAERSAYVPGAYLMPPELSLLCQGPSGRILTFGINLKDIFSAVRDSGKLSLHADLAGHKSPVRVIGAHPNLPFVVTGSASPHELVVWRIKYRDTFHPRELVQVIALATVPSTSAEPYTHVVWVPQLEEDVSAAPKVLYFIAADRSGTLFLYRFRPPPHPEVVLLSKQRLPAAAPFVSLMVHLERSSIVVSESPERTAASLSESFVPSTSFGVSSSASSSQTVSVISSPKIFLLGLTAASALTVWKLRFEGSDTDATMTMTHCWSGGLFDDGDETSARAGELLFADQLDSVTVSMTHGTLLPAFLFCTVHVDRELRMWRRCTAATLEQALVHAARDGTGLCEAPLHTTLPRTPSTVSAAAYGFVAVAYADVPLAGNRTEATVEIYDYLRDCTALRRTHRSVHRESFDSDVVCKGLADLGMPVIQPVALPVSLSWTCLPEGSLALAVGVGAQIFVFGRFRLRREKSHRAAWECLASVVYSERTPLLGVAFTGPEGHLLCVGLSEPILSLVSPWAWAWSDILTLDQAGEADETPPSLAMMLAAALPLMPDYHPDVLVQYALSGEFELVRSILRHLRDAIVLLLCMAEKPRTQIPPMPLGRLVMSSTLASSASGPGAAQRDTAGEAAGARRGGATADDFMSGPTSSARADKYDELFATMSYDVDDDHEPGVMMAQTSDGAKAEREWKHNDDDMFAYLSETLTTLALPGITQTEQVTLLAVIDTLVQREQQKRALDDNGGRFALALRLHTFLRRTLPPQTRPAGLSHRDTAWGIHSQSEDILLELCTSMSGAVNQVTWKTQKPYGLGWWPASVDALRRHVEVMAKNQFNNSDPKDPVSCSLFYLALGKRKVLAGLWKLAHNHPEQAKMSQFFSNDFDQPRWKQAALKNAYALLGRQRFEYAAAFFLLGGSISDAVNVLKKNLCDPQLALIVARLASDGGASLQALLRKGLLPSAVLTGDRWLASNTLWLAGDRERAAAVLAGDMLAYLEPDELEEYQHLHRVRADELGDVGSATQSAAIDSSLLIHFRYLRSLPNTVKAARSQPSKWPAISLTQLASFTSGVAASYEDLGATVLALEAVRVGSQLCADVSREAAATKRLQRRQSDGRATDGGDRAELLFGGPSEPQDKAEFLFGGPDTFESASSLFALDAPTTSFALETGTLDMGQWGMSTAPSAASLSATRGEPRRMSTTGSEADDAHVDPQLEHMLRILSVQRCAMSLRLSLSVATALCEGNRLWFVERQQSSQRLLTYGEEAYNGLYVLCGLASDPSLHPSLVQRWLRRVCHMTERTVAHCALLAGASFKHAQMALTKRPDPSSPAMDSIPAQSASVASTVTDLLYRKCTSAASLAFMIARDWDDTLERHLVGTRGTFDHVPEKPRPMVLKLDFITSACIALLEALYIERQALYLRLLTSSDRDGPARLREMLWCLILASLASLLMQEHYVRVGHWLRGIRGVFLNKPINGQFEPFHTLLTIAITANEEARHERELNRDLRRQQNRTSDAGHANGGGHHDDDPDDDDDDDQGLQMRSKQASRHGLTYTVAAEMLQLATFRYLFCRLEATLEDLESQVDVSSSAISDGLVTSLALLIGIKERRVSDTLPMGLVEVSADMMPTAGQQRLWSTLQELYMSAGITDRYVNPTVAAVSARQSMAASASMADLVAAAEHAESASVPPSMAGTLASTAISAGGSLGGSGAGSGVASPTPSVSPTPGGGLQTIPRGGTPTSAIPRVASASQVADASMADYGAGELVCRATDIIEAFCINKAEVDCISLSAGRRVYELKTTPTMLPIVPGLPGRSGVTRTSTDGSDAHEESLLSPPYQSGPEAPPQDLPAVPRDTGAGDPMSPRARRIGVIESASAADAGVGGTSLSFNDDVLLRKSFDTLEGGAPSAKHGHKRSGSYGGPRDGSFMGASAISATNAAAATYQAAVSAAAAGMLPAESSSRFVRGIQASAMVSHPSLPFYLMGTQDGTVQLWQYHQPPLELMKHQLPESPRVTSLRFSLFGVKFGSTDMRGHLNLFNFDARQDLGHHAYNSIQVHSRAAHDFVFLTSASFIATGGVSETQKNVALWDMLLPPGKARVRGFIVHENGCHSLGFSAPNNLLISGGKKGDLSIFDLRAMQPLRSKMQAHSHNIKSIAVDDVNGYFYTGSTDGDIRVWSMQSLECVHTIQNAHPKNTFVRASFDRNPVSTYGVMDLVVDDYYLYSCGADGTLKRHLLLTQQ